MKYILKTLNPETHEIVSEKEYRSLLQMSKDLKTTYCSCYNNFLFMSRYYCPATLAIKI